MQERGCVIRDSHNLSYTILVGRYKFRVKSENDYGISEPGEESDAFDVGATGENRCVTRGNVG